MINVLIKFVSIFQLLIMYLSVVVENLSLKEVTSFGFAQTMIHDFKIPY